MEVQLSDSTVAKLHVENQLQREASHAVLRNLVTQMEGRFTKPLDRGRLPASVKIHALDSLAEKRVRLKHGTVCVVSAEDDTVNPEFEKSFDVSNVFIANHTVDRGSTNGAVFFHAVRCHMLWIVHWGVVFLA